MVLIIFLYAMLASTFSLAKELVQILPPIFLIAVRMIISGSLLSATWISSKDAKKIEKADWWLFALVTLFHILIPYTTEFIALKNISPSSACLMYNLSPFLSALFSYFAFKEKMTIKKWIGFIIGFGGILFYLKDGLFFETSAIDSYSLMIISVATASLGWIFVRLLVRHKGYSPILVNGLAMFLGGFLALPSSYYFEGSINFAVVDWWYVLSLMALIILITNILFYNLYSYLLTKYTATFLSFVGFVTPLFAALFEWLFYGTVVSTDFFISVFIIGVGIVLFYQEELRQGYIIKF